VMRSLFVNCVREIYTGCVFRHGPMLIFFAVRGPPGGTGL
jgi:hypothetical protein